MDSTAYLTISRQSGLMKEMQSIANNIANANTTGFRRSGFMFSEAVDKARLDQNLMGEDLNEGSIGRQFFSREQGYLDATGGTFDLAIEGEGYFLVEGLAGERLTRAGNFQLDNQRRIVNAEGMPLLNIEGEPFQIPIDVTDITIAEDGTISADGQPLGQITVVDVPPGSVAREGANLWRPMDGFDPAPEARVLQGHLEGSNVQPVAEIARLIEVQRNYEMNQRMLDKEDTRVTDVAQALRQG